MTVETGRLETFSDGVFAIAATLLILNVDSYVRSCTDDAGLASHLLCGWPSYIAYVVSFLTIGIIWANHHTVMNQIARADRTFLMLTVGFLMVVAFIPFPTGLVAENINGPGARAATVTYGITLTLTAVMFNAIWFYAAQAAPAAPRRTPTNAPSAGSPRRSCWGRGSTWEPPRSRRSIRPRGRSRSSCSPCSG